MTPLNGLDGTTYAMASGQISIGGFSFTADAAAIQQNHPTTGRVPNGAILEEDIVTDVSSDGRYRLLLNHPDFETARRITGEINLRFPLTARTIDAGAVSIVVPGDWLGDIAGFIGELNGLIVVPDVRAFVVVNERTGTVILGNNVRISRVAITHGNLSVITNEQPQVSQPGPFADGETAVVPRSQMDVIQEDRALMILEQSTTVGDLANGLNALGVSPRDLSSIFQQLKESGALHADLQFK